MCKCYNLYNINIRDGIVLFGRKNNVKYEMTSPFHKVVTNFITIRIIAVAVALLLMVAIAGIFDTVWTQIICTLIGVYVYVSMLYSTSWGIAERERNLVKFGHIKEDKLRGLRAGLYSSIPLFVFTVIAIIQSYTNIMPEWVLPVYRFITCPFIGFVVLFLENNISFLLLLLCAVAPISTWLGYKNGYALYRFTDKIMYTKPRSKDKRVR